MLKRKMKANRTILGALVLVALFTGCDMDITGEKRDARMREAQEREQEERTRRETEAQRNAMTKFATGKRQFFKTRLAEVVGEENALRADLKTLTTVVADAMSEKDAQGNEHKYETKVLRILKNPEVNALAAKYLASDFSSVVATYVERVREARAADAKYDAAIESAEAIYKSGVGATKDWSKATQKQRDAEISRLQKEVKALETSRDRTLREYKSVTRNESKRTSIKHSSALDNEHLQRTDAVKVYERRLDDIERQLAVKRRQIDYLTSPEVMNLQANRALDTAQRRQQEAINTRRSALADINRQLKPKKSLTDTVAEFEADTVGKLRKTLSDKIAVLEKNEKILKDKVAMADEILLAIPLCDLGELKRQRIRLEQ